MLLEVKCISWRLPRRPSLTCRNDTSPSPLLPTWRLSPNRRTPIHTSNPTISMSYLADQLKEKGNDAFRKGEYIEAEDLYTQAVQKYSRNPLIFTNRANVRLKLQRWDGAVNDCLKSIEITGPNGQNHKAFYFLGKAGSMCHTVRISSFSQT